MWCMLVECYVRSATRRGQRHREKHGNIANVKAVDGMLQRVKSNTRAGHTPSLTFDTLFCPLTAAVTHTVDVGLQLPLTTCLLFLSMFSLPLESCSPAPGDTTCENHVYHRQKQTTADYTTFSSSCASCDSMATFSQICNDKSRRVFGLAMSS